MQKDRKRYQDALEKDRPMDAREQRKNLPGCGEIAAARFPGKQVSSMQKCKNK